jgi:hypothetical protein
MKNLRAKWNNSQGDKRVPLTKHLTGLTGFSVSGETDQGCKFSAIFDWRDEANSYEISTLEIKPGDNGSPVNGTALRDIKVNEIIQWVLWAGSLADSAFLKSTSTLKSTTGLTMAKVREQIHERRDIGEKFRPSNEVLELASTIYEFASLSGKRPVKLIQDDFGIPPSTASHWVKLARDRGNLEL